MPNIAVVKSARLPRFRRASEPPAFRLTDDDVKMVRLLAHHRFLQSTHIAALVGRSLDRTNDRLRALFHAGYVDRPRAQLDYYPTFGSAPMVYALADRGARLLIERDGIEFANVEWSRKNRSAGRPFIEHQVGVSDFRVAMEQAVAKHRGIRLLTTEELIEALPKPPQGNRNPLSLRVRLSHQGTVHDIGVVPDLALGLQFADGSRRCFVVEIDRGTMPVVRADYSQTSFERKMRAYLAAYAAKQHERQFGWKTFRVLTVTTDEHRMRSMMQALRNIRAPNTPGGALFFFATRSELQATDPLSFSWHEGTGRAVSLI